MDYTPEEYSTMSHHFLSLLGSDEGIEKLNQEGASFLRARLREVSFWRQVQPPVPVKDTDLEVSTEHDTLVKIVDIEPGSTAFSVNFRGRGNIRYIRGRRYAIPFFTITSERFRKSEAELRAYRYPITKIIEENTILDLQEQEDKAYMRHVRNAVTTTGKQIVNLTDTEVHKLAMSKLLKLLDSDKRKASVLLMTKTMFDDLLTWGSEEAGHQWVSKVTTDGYTEDRLMGHKLITTIKNDIVQANEVWCFTEPKFLGNSYILENTKFWLDKRGRIIEMEAYEDIGIGIGNLRSIARLAFGKIDPLSGQPLATANPTP